MDQNTPLVGIIMGSDSDGPGMENAAKVLKQLGVPYEAKVVSAHRTPDLMKQYAEQAPKRGIKVIIAGAGGAAHLPGMVAAFGPLPVIGVPIENGPLKGVDALHSIVQMPGGVPVATVGIGNSKNAGLLAAQMIAHVGGNQEIRTNLAKFRSDNAQASLEKTLNF